MPEGTMSSEKADHEGVYATVVALRRVGFGIIGTDRAVVNSVAGALRT
jgi:hypothetical protein